MGLIYTGSMHRLTARLLLCFALVGNLVPLALAATAPAHACCVRKAAHHCHGSLAPEQLSETGPVVVRDAGTCNHDCCRAVTTAQWAQTRPSLATRFAYEVEAYLSYSSVASPHTGASRFQSTRAPPDFFIA